MTAFDPIAQAYEFLNKSRYKYDADSVLSVIKPETGQVFLDIGGGTGAIASLIAQKTGCRFTVVDHSAQMIVVGRKRDKKLNWLNTDLTKPLPLKSSSVDGIIMTHTLHHITRSRQLDLLGELRRVLKPAGSLIIIEMDSHNIFSQLMSFIEKLMTFNRVWYLSPQQLQEKLKAAGFKKLTYSHRDQGYLVTSTT